MNAAETKAAIAVMQHYADGGAVQIRDRAEGGWEDYVCRGDGPAWDWTLFDYRIKPRAPREFCVEAFPTRSGPVVIASGATVVMAIHSAHQIEPHSKVCPGHIRVREVVE